MNFIKNLINKYPALFLIFIRLPLIWYSILIVNLVYLRSIGSNDLIPTRPGPVLLSALFGGIIGYLLSVVLKKLLLGSASVKPETNKSNPDAFIIPLENENPLILNNIFNGVMIVGQPGSGKTASAIHPLLYQVVEKDWTGLIYDLKGKLADEVISCYNSLSDRGNHKTSIKFINFANPLKSQRVNPIAPEYMKNKADVIEFANTLLTNLMATDGSKSEDPFWFNNARNILSAVVWFLRNNHPKFCTIPHAIAFIYWKDSDALLETLKSDPESARMISTLNASSQAQDKKLFINILSTLYTHLMGLDLPELFFTLSENEANLNVNSRENPTLLTIANYEPLQKVYSPIIAAICNVVTQRMNEEDKLKGIIMFDEFASIKIPNFERTPETIRSRGVATVIALQDKQQLITKYGDSIAETIASCLATKFYFKSTNTKTVEEAVKIFGKRDVKFTTHTNSNIPRMMRLIMKPTAPTVSESIQERDYLKIEEITNYERGQFAGIYSDANVKYGKGQKIKLSLLKERSSLPTRSDITDALIQDTYKKIYLDIASIFIKKKAKSGVNADDLKVNF